MRQFHHNSVMVSVVGQVEPVAVPKCILPESADIAWLEIIHPNVVQASSVTADKKQAHVATYLQVKLAVGLIHSTVFAVPCHHFDRLDLIGFGDLGIQSPNYKEPKNNCSKTHFGMVFKTSNVN